MNPPKISKLDHVVLRVSDIKKSIAFYRDILGCTEARIKPESGLYQFQAGASMIDLVPQDSELGRREGYGPPEKGRNVDHIALKIENFNEKDLQHYLEAHGIKVTESGRRFGADGFGPSIYFSDPDGNIVELKG
jgi:glyoxylase I family protein